MADEYDNKKAVMVISNALPFARIGGTTERPQIHFEDSEPVRFAFEELDIDFLDRGRLIVADWRSIGIMYGLGLLEIGDSPRFKKAGVVRLNYPDGQFAGANYEYTFPTQLTSKSFPKGNVREDAKARVTVLQPTNPDEYFEKINSVFEGIVHKCYNGEEFYHSEDIPREYTRFPNMKVFGKQKYKWKGRKLFRCKTALCTDEVEVSLDEIQEIHTKAAQGDLDSLDEFIRIHLGWALTIVADMQDLFGGDADDMLQVAFEGLLDALARHDPERGKFTTYSKYWMEQKIRKQHSDTHRLIRRPSHRNSEVVRYYSIRRQLEQELQREPRRIELAKKFDMTDVELDAFERQNGIEREIVGFSYGDQLTEGHVSFSASEYLVDLGSQVEREVSLMHLSEVSEDCLNGLTPKERNVLYLRTGLKEMYAARFASAQSQNGLGYLSLEQVGRHHDVTRERVRQIEARALRRLRHPHRSNRLRDFLDDDDLRGQPVPLCK